MHLVLNYRFEPSQLQSDYVWVRESGHLIQVLSLQQSTYSSTYLVYLNREPLLYRSLRWISLPIYPFLITESKEGWRHSVQIYQVSSAEK